MQQIAIIQSALAVVTGNDKGRESWTVLMELARQTSIQPDQAIISRFRAGRADLDCTLHPHPVD